MRVIAQFRSVFNVSWESDQHGLKAFAYVRGFPATIFLTSRRLILIGEFLEKEGWLKKKKFHRIIFEASLAELKNFELNLDPNKKLRTGFISFHAHGDIGEGATIQFFKVDLKIGQIIKDYLTRIDIKKPPTDSGIIMIEDDAPPVTNWVKDRLRQ